MGGDVGDGVLRQVPGTRSRSLVAHVAKISEKVQLSPVWHWATVCGLRTDPMMKLRSVGVQLQGMNTTIGK